MKEADVGEVKITAPQSSEDFRLSRVIGAIAAELVRLNPGRNEIRSRLSTSASLLTFGAQTGLVQTLAVSFQGPIWQRLRIW